MSRDLLRYASDKFSRLANKIGQRTFNRGYRAGNFDAMDITRSVREVSIKRQTVERLKDAGILNRDLRFDQIPVDYLGRMLSLDMFTERVESIQAMAYPNTVAVEAA